MKSKLKFFLTILITVIIGITSNYIFSYGNVSQAITTLKNGERVLLYRLFVSPLDSTVVNYHNEVEKLSNKQYVYKDNTQNEKYTYTYTYKDKNGNKVSKPCESVWVYPKEEQMPTHTQFDTIGHVFHKEPLGTYGTKGQYGYMYLNKPIIYSTRYPDTVDNVFQDNAYQFVQSVSLGSVVSKDKGNSFADKVFYRINNVTGTFSTSQSGTGLELTGANRITGLYRYCIINFAGYGNVYVEDIMINETKLTELINAIKESGAGKNFYTSSIVASEKIKDYYWNVYNPKVYEVAFTADKFFKQAYKDHLRDSNLNFWSSGTIGYNIELKGINSIINLYDNKLIMPNFGTRQVMVRHYEVTNEDNINQDKQITDTSMFSYYLSLSDNTKVYANNTNSYNEEYRINSSDKGFSKNAISNDNYRCLGYKLCTSSSREEALNGIKKLNKLNAKTTSASVGAKTNGDESDYTIIDFYYTKHDKNIVEKHFYVDKDNKVVEEITYANRTIAKQLNETTVIVKNDDIKGEYKGCQTFNSLNDTNIGTQVSNLNTAKSVEIDDDSKIVQVNFYYFYKEPLTEEKIDVRHIYIDEKGKVIEEISSESKTKSSNEGIIISRDENIRNYKGYETFTKVKKTKIGEIQSNLNTAESVTIEANSKIIQVNFYYEKTPVVVKNIYVDKDNNVIKEIDTSIKTKNANSEDTIITKREDIEEYKGYETFTELTTTDSLKGEKRKPIKNDSVTIEANSEILQVNFYYEQVIKIPITVKNIYVDKYNRVLEEISENTEYRDSNKSLKITKDNKINGEYKGYEIFDTITNTNSLKGTGSRPLNSGTSVTLGVNSKTTQVNFYYYVDNSIDKGEPTRTIGGKLFVNPCEGELTTTCNDSGKYIVSVPSGSNVTLGIKDLPNYMVTSLYSEYKEKEIIMNTTISLKLNGNRVYGINLNNTKLKIAYNNITEAVVHKISKMMIYDNNLFGKNIEIKTFNNNPTYSKTNAIVTINLMKGDTLVEEIGSINYLTNNTINKGNFDINLTDNKDTVTISRNQLKSGIEILEALGYTFKLSIRNPQLTINNTLVNTEEPREYTVDNNKDKLYETGRLIVSQDLYKGIGPNIDESKYNNKNLIKTAMLNGVKALSGEVTYTSFNLIGNGNKVDNVYYLTSSIKDGKEYIFSANKNNIVKKYEVNTKATTNEEKYREVDPVNVYTPISISAKYESSILEKSNQSFDDNKNFIQDNIPFKILLDNSVKNYIGYSDLKDTSKYNLEYYAKFSFAVKDVKINGTSYNGGKKVAAETWIKVPINQGGGNTYIEATPNQSDLPESGNTYKVMAFAYNSTNPIRIDVMNAINIQNFVNENLDTYSNICYSPTYFAQTSEELYRLNRVYDFKVTDVSDVNWKNVFRVDSNKHSGILYYAGITKWNINTNDVKDVANRTVSEIGRNPLRTLPIGPYKSTDITYLKAPKIGYRISYDLKVTGNYYNTNGNIDNNKNVVIETKFYYISKDGKTLLTEYDGTEKGIYLFYKDASGKYIRIDSNGGNYNLSFIPNDGYRYIDGTKTGTLWKSKVNLGNLRKVTLTSAMATISNNGNYITYYGEYKLPNSTIAVQVEKNGTYNVNNPLKDGYIGVVFDIKANIGNVQLSYSKNTEKEKANTSQWDYEGFLGYKKAGEELKTNTSVSIKLENGTWVIKDNNTYNKVKGTVVLFDLDDRAATDYE